MNLEQEKRAEKLYQELGLDPVVNKVLQDFPNSLSGIDRVLDKIFGPYDIKGRAKAVAGLTALITYTGLGEEHKKEVERLKEQIKSLEGERDRVKTSYEYLVQKAVSVFEGDYKDLEKLELEKEALTADLERLKSSYEELGIAITTLADTIPYDEIGEKSGQTLYTILHKDPNIKEMLKGEVSKSDYLKKFLGMAAEKGAEEAGRHAIEKVYKVMKDRIDKIRIEVIVYTKKEVFSGSVYHLEGERLSDLLNDMSDRGGWRSSSFIRLYNVNVRDPDGRNEILPTAHINKTNAKMVILTDSNAARGIGAEDGPRSFPYVLKSPVRVDLQMANYALSGNVHCARGQRTQDVINEKVAFLPLTEVSVRKLRSDDEFTSPFVALNKEEILPLKPREIPLDSLEPINKYYKKLLELRLGYLN